MINYSIIIPHYNIPDLLMRCLHSIPVRPDVQVIVVDDCSPGADKYLETYPELSRPYLEFYSTPKGGSAGRARNVGLDHAQGKWLIFADADDFFVENLGEILNEYMNAEEDVIYFNSEGVLSDNPQIVCVTKCSSFKKYFETKPYDETNFRCDHPVPWAKFVKHSFVRRYNIRFGETRWSNDILFAVTIGTKAEKIKIANRVLYYITEREGSLTDGFCRSRDEILVRAEVGLQVQEIINNSPYTQKHPYFADDLLRLYFMDKSYFVSYFKKLKIKNISRIEMLYHVCQPCGFKDTLRIWTFVIIHCFRALI